MNDEKPTMERLSKPILDSDISDINTLLGDLSDHPPCLKKLDILQKLLNPQLHWLVIRDISTEKHYGSLIGMVCIEILGPPMGVKGFIDDVVLLEACRRKGLGKAIVQKLIFIAYDSEAKYIDLTSNPNNPKRHSAIKLYKKLGFKLIARGVNGKSDHYRLEAKDFKTALEK